MSNLLKSSIGKKLIMSISGLFLCMFILVHLTLNLFLVFDESGDLFNIAAHFMATNPLIKLMEPILALGFIVHIIMSIKLSLENRKARPISYVAGDKLMSWISSSKNMLILGSVIVIFLGIHIYNFWWNMKAGALLGVDVPNPLHHVTVDGVVMENAYKLVSELFISSICYCILYIIGGVFLGLHLAHGVWSGFQSIGINNQIWEKRWKFVANLFAIIVAVGFSIIPLYFIIRF